MKSWKCSQLWPAECFFLFTVMNFKKLFVRNLKKNMRGGGGFPHQLVLYRSLETSKRTRKSVFFTSDDIVLLQELQFCPMTWVGGGRCSLEVPFFFFSLPLFVFILNCSEIPRLSQKLEVLAFDAVWGDRALGWNTVWQVCLKKQLMCFKEGVQAVLSLCSCPDGMWGLCCKWELQFPQRCFSLQVYLKYFYYDLKPVVKMMTC